MGSLYGTDLVLWAMQQAEALRSAGRGGSNAAVDWENVAEEIESLGRSERRTLASHIRTVIEHLMKLHVSVAAPPRLGWKETVLRARFDIEDVLDDSPSLRRDVPALITRQTARAARSVAADPALDGETPQVDPAGLAFTEDQILGDWLPD